MELDSTASQSIASENNYQASSSAVDAGFLRGNYVVEADRASGSRIEVVSSCPELESTKPEKYFDPTSWGYLLLHYRKAEKFADDVAQDARFRCFVHKTVVYEKTAHSVKRIVKPTISGLVFIQGKIAEIQQYLKAEFFPFHLVNDRVTGLPAVIPDKQMQPFMRIMQEEPTRIRVLDHPIEQYASGNVKLRVLTGAFAGQEGYLVRIARDRKLVVNVGGMTVAISGICKEQFEQIRELTTP